MSEVVLKNIKGEKNVLCLDQRRKVDFLRAMEISQREENEGCPFDLTVIINLKKGGIYV